MNAPSLKNYVIGRDSFNVLSTNISWWLHNAGIFPVETHYCTDRELDRDVVHNTPLLSFNLGQACMRMDYSHVTYEHLVSLNLVSLDGSRYVERDYGELLDRLESEVSSWFH